ncbi:MAG: glycoside hydrolase family 97 N-terminal domain-containing protein [Acidobacteria bacterium]|nr:glycoside hydrolase family 97 N-terminal domain-containing protein [Acidobacteriota bacterium]
MVLRPRHGRGPGDDPRARPRRRRGHRSARGRRHPRRLRLSQPGPRLVRLTAHWRQERRPLGPGPVRQPGGDSIPGGDGPARLDPPVQFLGCRQSFLGAAAPAAAVRGRPGRRQRPPGRRPDGSDRAGPPATLERLRRALGAGDDPRRLPLAAQRRPRPAATPGAPPPAGDLINVYAQNDLRSPVHGYSLLMEVPGVAWMAVTEADMRDYAAMYLVNPAGSWTGRWFESRLAPSVSESDICVSGALPHHSSWRVLLTGAEPGRLIVSNVIASLNPESAIQGTTWIRAGRAAWDWWSGSIGADGKRAFTSRSESSNLGAGKDEPPRAGRGGLQGTRLGSEQLIGFREQDDLLRPALQQAARAG